MGFVKEETAMAPAKDFLWKGAVCHAEFEHDGAHYLIQAATDEDVGNPREEFDHAWVWAATSGAGCGDKWAMSLDDWSDMSQAEKELYLSYPLGLLRHSGDTVYIGDKDHWSDPGGWDSGQMGVAYMTKKEAVAAWGKKGATRLTEKIRKAAYECLREEVNEMNCWLHGEVYGVGVTLLETGWEDSLWGHYCDSREALWQAMRQLLPDGMTEEEETVADSMEWA
jgi:hypothetical protein